LRSIILPAIKREMKNRRDLLLNADRVVFVSRYVRRVIKKNIASLKGDVIHNGVDLQSIQASLNTPSNYSLKDSFALYIGKIEKHKGSEILKSLFKSKKVDLPLVVIGEGSEREELIKTAEENNRRSVFLNWIANNEVLKIMSSAQFLLFPSVWAEPLSRVLLEAASVGLPVVAVNSGGTPEIIENNRNGFLVKNSEEFIRKANQLSNDNVMLKRLSQQGKQITRDRFDQNKLTRKWVDLYEKVIKENKKSRD
jgi:glycogen(starch) synthase